MYSRQDSGYATFLFTHMFLTMKIDVAFIKAVMGQTQFHRTSNEFEHHFSNIKQTQTCSSICVRTPTPYFWLQTIK